MFRTDFNLWLQQFDNPSLVGFMRLISFFGEITPVMLLVLIVFSAIHFRKGFILFNLVSFTAIFTVWLKMYFDYPRPVAVDDRLQSWSEQVTTQSHIAIQPKGFFDVFDQDILTVTRSYDFGRQGLPSGHTAIMIAIWFGIAWLFKKRWLWIWACVFVVLTAFSRMYLGMHYIGDILGGVVTGLIAIFMVTRYALRSGMIDDEPIRLNSLWLIGMVSLLGFAFGMRTSPWMIAILVANNAAVLLLFWNKTLPEIYSKWHARLYCSVSYIIPFLAIFFISKRYLDGMALIAALFILSFSLLIGWTTSCIRLGWMKLNK